MSDNNVCITCNRVIENEDTAWRLYDGSWFCDYNCTMSWDREHAETRTI